MRKKVLLMTAIGLVLLGAVIAAALNAVFTVTDVIVHYVPVSETGGRESYLLQEELDGAFVGKSTTFLDLEEVKAVISRYPGYELKEIRKEFPRSVVITVEERREAFSFVKEDGLYAILDEEGIYLYDKEENANRRSGENILLKGFTLSAQIGESPEGEFFEAAVALADVFLEKLPDARTNVRSVTLMSTDNALAGSHFLRVQMCEGIVIDFYGVENLIREKAEDALEKYLSLSDDQRLYGFFDIVDKIDGGFSVSEHRAETPIGM